MYNLYIDGVEREVNFTVLGEGWSLKLVATNGEGNKINQLLFEVDSASA